MSRIEDRLPGLSARIVGGLGVLLLSPTVLTAASRSRLEESGPASQSPGARSKAHADLRMRIAVAGSGLVAATSLAYTAPGTPWARADVLATPSAIGGTNTAQTPAVDGHGTDPALDLAHEATPYSGVVRTADRTFLVDATPAAVGTNTVAITVLDAKGAPATVQGWSATASLPEATVPDVAVPLKGFGPGVAAADAVFPVAGRWTITVTVRVAGADPTSFTHVIPIEAQS